MELYDFSYIDDKIIGGVEKNLPNVADILARLERKAIGGRRKTGTETGGLSQSGKSGTEFQSES
jgi:hypothetical protein